MATKRPVLETQEGRKEKAREGTPRARRGGRRGSLVSGEELGNTRQFSLSVPGGAGSSCVRECVYAKLSAVSVSARVWVCVCVRVCARGHRNVGGSARARCGCQPVCPCVRALVCTPKCARAGDIGRVPPPPQPRPPLSYPRRKSRLPPPVHPAHPLLPHFLLLSLLRAHSRTPRSSRWPS